MAKKVEPKYHENESVCFAPQGTPSFIRGVIRYVVPPDTTRASVTPQHGTTVPCPYYLILGDDETSHFVPEKFISGVLPSSLAYDEGD